MTDDLACHPERSRRGSIIVTSTLFLTEMQYEPSLLLEEVSQIFGHEDREAFWLFVNWLWNRMNSGRMSAEEFARLAQMITSKEEVKAMLLTTMQDYYEKVEREAFVKGEYEGEVKGEIKGKIEVARVMLTKGLSPALIAEMTGLPETVIGRVNVEDISKLMADISRN